MEQVVCASHQSFQYEMATKMNAHICTLCHTKRVHEYTNYLNHVRPFGHTTPVPSLCDPCAERRHRCKWCYGSGKTSNNAIQTFFE